MHFLKISIYSFSVLFISACQNTSHDDGEVAAIHSTIGSLKVHAVQIAESKIQHFPLQVLATGKISALVQAKINFKTTGVIEKILIKNSSLVKEGQVLAILENEQQKIALQQSFDILQDARLELNKLVLEYGGKDRDTNSVSKRILENIKAKSGFNKALTNLRDARLKLENTYLKAPYAGIIANLKTKAFNPSSSSEPFCTLLSKENMVVELSILESELGIVNVGQHAIVTSLAFPDRKYTGIVTEINPMVNEQGLVLLKVKIVNPDQYLLEGMNAQVIIEKILARQVVVPKEAVVERSGKKVVFVYEDGLAKWKFVTVSHENSQDLAISEGLSGGQKVIVKGNLNLGHDAKVEIVH
ncbi:efflux RND transporter periplasmic adaptor subunit [Aquirufa salirivi]|uniref:Efflux RND transporter periplasmic adaptor subunit n=1 Tax=Aquirufa salirivi TaxID=3104729 RepID=A0ABW8RVL0_9BACT